MNPVRTARFSTALIRLIVYLFVTFVGRIILGSILLISGLIYGFMSHDIVYQQAPPGRYKIDLVTNGDDYFQLDGSNTLYIIHAVDFNPYPVPDTFGSDVKITSMIYKTDSEEVDVHLVGGEQIRGTGHQLVQFSLTDASGNNPQTFATAEYTQHPVGYYDNHWPVAAVLIVLGLLFLGVSFVFRSSEIEKKRAQQAAEEEALKNYDPWASNKRFETASSSDTP